MLHLHTVVPQLNLAINMHVSVLVQRFFLVEIPELFQTILLTDFETAAIDLAIDLC